MLYIYYGENYKSANIGYNTLAEVYANVARIKTICETDTNIHVSMNHCEGDNARTFVSCDLIYFDIEQCDPEKNWETILNVVADVLGADPKSFWVNMSGCGLHLICSIPKMQTGVQYSAFQTKYKTCLDILRRRFEVLGISCIVDNVFKKTQTLRVPQTVNEKYGITAYILQRSNGAVQDIISPSSVEIKKPEVLTTSGQTNEASANEKATALPVISMELSTVNIQERIVDDASLGEYRQGFGVPDTQSVLSRCKFLQHCADSPQTVREPEWYAMLSVTSRLENGRDLSHQMSQGHPKYDFNETDIKITRALDTGGPRTCKDINSHWGKCNTCPEFTKITSPITLKSKQHVATKTTGFHFQEVTKSGALINKPDHQGMVRHLANEYHMKVSSSDNVYLRQGDIYKEVTENDLKSISRTYFKPDVFARDTHEFLKRTLECADIKTEQEPNNYKGFLSCKNGIVDLMTGELLPHSPDFFFTTQTEISYDKNAQCPKFDLWLQKIFKENQTTIDIVLDYLAYSMVGTTKSNERFMVFQGSGANGKSVLIKIMKKIMGEYVNFSRKNSFLGFGKDIIVGSRLIVFEELPKESDEDFWQEIKDLSAGGVARINRKYKNEINHHCTAKFLFTCNELPHGTDHTNGFYRRLLLIKFPLQFSDDEIQPNFEETFSDELSGILSKIISRIPDLVAKDYKITTNDSLKEAADELKLDRDIVYQYFNEFVTYDSDEVEPNFVVKQRLTGEKRIRFDDLYVQHFVKYCEDSGVRLIPKNQLLKRIKQYLKDDIYFCELQRRYLVKNVYPRS